MWDGYGVEMVWGKWSWVVERWAWLWGVDVADGYLGWRVSGMGMGLWG